MKGKNMKSKLAVVTWTFAPEVSGSPILLNNLFHGYNSDLVAIVGRDISARIDPGFKPACRKVSLRFANDLFEKIYRRYRYNLSFLVNRFVLKQIKKEKPNVVFGVYPNDVFLVAAYKACKKLNLPLVVHMHDLWLDNYEKGSTPHTFGSKYEKQILEYAEIVYCMTDTQMEYLNKKYNLKESKLLPHSIPSEKIANFERKELNKSAIKKILYTGNVSERMNLDALKTFVKMVDKLPKEYEVSMLVNFKEKELRKKELFNDRIHYDWVTMEEAVQLQENADLLFLPLSHKNCSPKEVKTVFATKTLDYLLSNTPILVYGPTESYHISSAKKNGWGYPVDEDSEQVLHDAIIKIVNNDKTRDELITNAVNEAKRRDTSIITNMLEKDIVRLSNRED